jgi:hypothetical protein
MAALHGQVPTEAGQPIPPPLAGGGIASYSPGAERDSD